MKSPARRRNIRNIGFGESWIRDRRVRDVEKRMRLLTEITHIKAEITGTGIQLVRFWMIDRVEESGVQSMWGSGFSDFLTVQPHNGTN